MDNYWLFQANPREDDLRVFLKRKKPGDKFTWRATRFKDPHDRMLGGDGVVMWQTRGHHPEAAGVYALGKLTGRIVGSLRKWQAEVILDHLRPLDHPIAPEVLLRNRALASLRVLKPMGAMGSNFRLDAAQWDAIRESWRGGGIDVAPIVKSSAELYRAQYGTADSIPTKSEYSHYFIGSLKENTKTGASRGRFARYWVGMSLQEAIASGIWRKDLRWDQAHGLITIVSKPPSDNSSRDKLPVAELRPLERYLTESTEVESAKSYIQMQPERELVTAYEAHMKRKGCDFRIPVSKIRADMYEQSRQLLVEAKGAATRENIRMAIGQLADYKRLVLAESLAVLLPERPSTDLEELLKSQKIKLIWRNADLTFSDNAQGTLS